MNKPTLLIDEEICKRNIAKMAKKANQSQVIFRPHFKTHQSAEIGQWFRDAGVSKITVSSLGMAKYFAENGWTDITVAIPVNTLEHETINDLASRIKLNLLCESTNAVQLLQKKLRHKVYAYIKIDTGYGRTGIHHQNIDKIDSVINHITQSSLIEFEGLLIHAGHSYQCRSKDEILEILNDTAIKATQLKSEFLSKFPNLIISVGDTPTCSVAKEFQEVDEIRPGNFVFYDLMQKYIGSNDWSDIAVAMMCPVVAKHPERNELIIYGGGVHFSKDSFAIEENHNTYGQIVSGSDHGWDQPIEGVYLKKLSQEHGTVHGTKEFIDKTNVGDTIKILPVHSCMTANLLKSYVSVQTQKIIQMYRPD